MKHLTVFVIGLALAIFLLGANAKMQQDTANLLRGGQQTATPNRDAYISDNSWHKLIIDANDQTTHDQLRSQGAIISEINYESFSLVVVDEQALGGKAAVQQLAASVQDDFDLISLNGYVLDTTNPDATYNHLPTDLRKTDMADAIARGTKPAGGLYIIQFAGPIQDAWLDALKATGVKVVTYIPSNAYIVRGSAEAALDLIGLAEQNQFAQFIGDYEPSFKLSPGLRAARENGGEIVEVTAQVIGGPGAKQTISNLSAMAEEVVGSFRALNYHNIELRVKAGRLAEMSRYDDVFAIEERDKRRRFDEAQGRVVARDLSTGPGYLARLASQGFSGVYQDFLNKGLAAPSAAMVKAYLMNSAAYMNGVGAGDNLSLNSQGMSNMDMSRSFDGEARVLVDQTQMLGATGQTFQTTATVANTNQPVRVTLVWADAAASTVGDSWVNNLDLEVNVNGTVFRGNVFSGGNSISGGRADVKNNAESVFLPVGTSGSITVTVKATNIAGDGVPGNADRTDQDFALVIYNANADGSAQPSIEASPASFSFNATAGGANPATQSLTITNTGGGTLHWSVSDDVPWLTLATTTGTVPAAVTLSVNIAGLNAGTRVGIITITDASAANSPVWITVTLTVSGNFLSNPGFESGNTTWVATPNVITNDSGQAAHGGTWKAWLNGWGMTHTDTLRQMVPIPSTATTVTLRFWLHIDSAETTTSVPFDKLQVQIRNSTGATVLATLATFSNLNKAAGYSLKSFDVTAFKGQTVSVYFLGTEDQVLQTSFVIDDVALNVQY